MKELFFWIVFTLGGVFFVAGVTSFAIFNGLDFIQAKTIFFSAIAFMGAGGSLFLWKFN